MTRELVDPFIRLVAYINNKPDKRRLELQGRNVWLRSEYGYSCVFAPGFDQIIAPTHDENFTPLFPEYE